MKSYKLIYLISPEVSEDDLKVLQEKITSSIQNEGGILDESELPIKKNLAYPIKKKTLAYLANLTFRSDPKGLENLEKKIKAEDKIIRYFILVKPRFRKVLIRVKKIPETTEVSSKKTAKPKVELKEIEKKLEEILEE